jgi:hypothetical protein
MTTQKNVLSIPALPIIQSAVIALAPLFDGKRHDGYINMLTALVRGEKTQEEVDTFLAENKIDAKANADFALFIGERREQQATACAAYIASSVLIEPNLAEFMEPMPSKDKSANAKPEFKIHQDKLTHSLSTKMAVALTNADIFAVIAKELQDKPNLTVEQYRTEVNRLFGLLATTYLERIQQHYTRGLNYNLMQIQNGQFIFSCSNGYLFSYDVNSLVLKLSGINWYGNGQLLGKDYLIDVAYLPESINAVLS